jgi:hypothetical protein
MFNGFGFQITNPIFTRQGSGGVAPIVLPTDISGLQVWYKPSGLVTAGSEITDWTDDSGNGYNMTQATSTNRPALATFLGKNAASFDGTNDFMDSPSVPYSTNDLTIFFIGQHTAITGQHIIYSKNVSTSERTFMMTTSQARTRIGGTNYDIGNVAPTGTPIKAIHAYDRDGNYSANINNVAIGSVSIAAASAVDLGGIQRLGGSPSVTLMWNGIVGELFTYNRLLTPEETTQINDYIFSEWGI